MLSFAIQVILSFCEGNYLFVSIDKGWRKIYILLFKKTETEIGHCSPQQIEYAIGMGYVLSDRTINSVAKMSNLDILKYFIKKHKHTLYGHVCAKIAESGSTNILKWARENDCQWDADTCAFAAKGGHFEMLKWARENGCPWDT